MAGEGRIDGGDRHPATGLLPLHDALFAETSPGPVKYAASLLDNGTSAHCRLPLAPLADGNASEQRAVGHDGA